MKKLILLIAFALPFVGKAQTIVNGNFESFTATSYDIPGTNFTTNPQTIQACGKASVIKSTDAHGGSYAVEVTTVTDGVTTAGGGFINGTPLNNHSFLGGQPYSSQPTDITGYYKYSTPGTDTGRILVIFKKNGHIIYEDSFKLVPASSYTKFDFKIALSSAPDTFMFGAVSSYQLVGNYSKPMLVAGSTLFLDDVSFTGATTMQTIPDGDFESWSNTTYDAPDGWSFEGNNYIVSTDAYKGKYALQMYNSLNGDGSVNITEMTNSTYSQRGNGHGRPFSNTVDTLSGHYKYTSVGGDSAYIYLTFFKNGSGMDFKSKYLVAESAYTYFEIPINLSFTPDSMAIDVLSSSYLNPHNGSSLLIDEIQLKSAPLNTGIWKTEKTVSSIRLYPNPANASIRIIPGNDFSKNSSLVIYNSVGQIMSSVQLNEPSYPNGIEIRLDGWKSGMYFYHLYSAGSTNEGNFIKE